MDMASVSNKNRVRQSFVRPAEGVLGTLPARQVHAVLDAIPAPSSTDKAAAKAKALLTGADKVCRCRSRHDGTCEPGYIIAQEEHFLDIDQGHSTSVTNSDTSGQHRGLVRLHIRHRVYRVLRVIEPNDDAGIQALYVPISWK
ncbi:hypothetical protein X797_008517 [Metarhizium robertsii]|uniref:Uncharacterized protein n=1 Tax=Metarhizium robertsii TaxID=568076 RepID=A0A0A1URR2_9HYPO|nr:hypothetical protein X797_008517 [Metarhizium robertsii]